MKTLAIIWAAVLLTGTGTAVYVNNAINAAVLQSESAQLQPANVCVQDCNPAPVQTTASYQVLNGNGQIEVN